MGLDYSAILIHDVKDISLALDVLRRNCDVPPGQINMWCPPRIRTPLSLDVRGRTIDLPSRSTDLGWIWLGVPLTVWAREHPEDDPSRTEQFVADGFECLRAWGGEVIVRVGRRHAVTTLFANTSDASRALLEDPIADQVRLIHWESNGLAALIDTEQEWFTVLASSGRLGRVYWPEWHWTRPPAPPFDQLVKLVLKRLAAQE